MSGQLWAGHPFRVPLLIILLILSVSIRAAAEDSLRLYYLSLPGLLEADGKTGPFATTLREVSRRAVVRFDMRHMVMNRMIRELLEDAPAAGVPQLGPMVEERFHHQMRLSPPVIFRCDYVFVRRDTDIPRTAPEMAGKTLVVSPLTTLPPPLRDTGGITVLKTPTDANALIALSMGRADMWVNDETTTMAAIKESGVTNIIYDSETPFYTWPAHMVFSDAVPETIVLRINDAILSMARDGTLARQLPQNFASQYETYLAAIQKHVPLSQR